MNKYSFKGYVKSYKIKYFIGEFIHESIGVGIEYIILGKCQEYGVDRSEVIIEEIKKIN